MLAAGGGGCRVGRDPATTARSSSVPRYWSWFAHGLHRLAVRAAHAPGAAATACRRPVPMMSTRCRHHIGRLPPHRKPLARVRPKGRRRLSPRSGVRHHLPGRASRGWRTWLRSSTPSTRRASIATTSMRATLKLATMRRRLPVIRDVRPRTAVARRRAARRGSSSRPRSTQASSPVGIELSPDAQSSLAQPAVAGTHHVW